jgi:type I restriction enzyme M protein
MNIGTMIKRLQDIMRQDAGVNGDAQRIEQIVWMLFLKLYDAKESEWEILEDNYKSIIPDEYRWRNWAPDNKDGKAITGDEMSSFIIQLFATLKDLEVNENTDVRGQLVKEVFTDLNNYMKDGVLIRQVVNVLNEIDLTDFKVRHAFNEIYETILKDLQSAGKSGEFYTPRAVTDFVVKMVNPKIGESIADFACGTGGFLVSALNYMKEDVSNTSTNEILQKSFYGVEKKSLPYLLCTTNMLLHDINEPQIIRGNSLEKNVRDYEENDKFDVILMNPPYGGTEKKSVQQNFPSELRDSETADLFIIEIMYRLKKDGRVGIVLPDGFLFGNDNCKIAIRKKLLDEFNLHTIIRLPRSIFAPYTSIATNLLFFDNTTPTKEIWYYRMDLPKGYKAFSKTKPVMLKHFSQVEEWWNNRREIIDEKNSTPDNTYYISKKYSYDEIANNNYNLNNCGYPVKEIEILPPDETVKSFIDKREELEKQLKTMTDNLNNFITKDDETILDAETSISDLSNELVELNKEFPNSMIQSLLDSAMKGNLVDNKSSETGEQFYERIKLEQEKHKIKNQKVSEIKPEDIPYSLPDNWKWVRIGDLEEINLGFTYKPKYESNGVIFLSVKDISSGRLDLDNVKYVSQDTYDNAAYGCKPQRGDILFGRVGTIGVPQIVEIDDPMCIFVSLGFFRDYTNLINKKYICYWMESFLFTSQVNKNVKGSAQINLNTNWLKEFLIPLPPIEVQNRIVSKLDRIIPIIKGN